MKQDVTKWITYMKIEVTLGYVTVESLLYTRSVVMRVEATLT